MPTKGINFRVVLKSSLRCDLQGGIKREGSQIGGRLSWKGTCVFLKSGSPVDFAWDFLVQKVWPNLKWKFSWITHIKEHIYTSYNKITRIFNNWRFVVCLLCNQVRKNKSMTMFFVFIISFIGRWQNLTCKTCNSDSSSLFDLHLTCKTKLQVWSKAESHSHRIACHFLYKE